MEPEEERTSNGVMTVRRPSYLAAQNVARDRAPVADRKEQIGWVIYDCANGPFFYGVLTFLPLLILGQANHVAYEDWCITQHSNFPSWNSTMGAVWNSQTDFTELDNKNGSYQYKIPEMEACYERGWAVDFENDGTCNGGFGWTDDRIRAAADELNTTLLNPGKPAINRIVCKGKESEGGAASAWVATEYKEATLVTLFGMFTVNYSAVVTTSATISVTFQLLLFLCLGSLADYGGFRKQMLMISNTVASVMCILVIFGASSYLYWYNALLMIGANLFYGFAVIFYNSYLSLLVMSSPEVYEVADRDGSKEELEQVITSKTTRLSTEGLAAGFTGQFVFVLITIVMLVFGEDTGLMIRVSALMAGLWALGFGAFTLSRLKQRPGKALPEGATYIGTSLKTTWRTLQTIKEMKQMFLFLGSYFIFSDGASTIGSAAATFAMKEIHLSAAYVMVSILLVSVCAVIGGFVFSFVERRFKVRPKVLLLSSLVGMSFLPIYALIALTTSTEFFFCAMLFGFFYGPMQAYTRAIFSEIIPEGREAEYFAFYEITDKGTAWLGPLVVTIVSTNTGSFRNAFGSLLVFFVLGSLVLLLYDDSLAKLQTKAFEAKHSKDNNLDSKGIPRRNTARASISTAKAFEVKHSKGINPEPNSENDVDVSIHM